MSKRKLWMVLVSILFLTKTLLSQATDPDSLQPGEWYIPPTAPSHITPEYMDSISFRPVDVDNPVFEYDTDTLGSLLWTSDIYETYDSTIQNTTFYMCTENYWLKTVARIDTVTDSVYQYTSTRSIDSSGSEFWTENISVSVIDSTSISINSSTVVDAYVYMSGDIFNEFQHLSIPGDNQSHTYTVTLIGEYDYLIAFVSNGNTIVDIKKIGALE